MKLTVVGTGYVGLVSGACLASLGHDVTCIDNQSDKIRSLEAGRIPFFEPGLEELVAEGAAAGRLHFSDSAAEAVPDAEVVFLTVGTPSRFEDGEADLSYVYAAVDELAKHVRAGAVMVSKSTVPVGTGESIAARLSLRRPEHTCEVVSCPEFLREGSAIDDFLKPHRVVVGAQSDAAFKVMRRVYQPLIDRGVPFLTMDRRSAELTKYAANAFLATKLAFINEMADFAEGVSANIEDVARAIGFDPRIGSSYLRVGPGFGGSCFPKDTMALHRNGEEVHAPLRIVETVIGVNEQRKRAMANRVIEACGGNVEGRRVVLLGVTFKANTDDLRDSPAIPIVGRLSARGALIHVFDPALPDGVEGNVYFSGVTWHRSAFDALESADVAVIVTDWDDFRHLDLAEVARRMARPVLVDLRNLFDPQIVAAAGIDYISLGRARGRGAREAEPRAGVRAQDADRRQGAQVVPAAPSSL